MTYDLIINESQIIVCNLYKFEIRSDFKNDIYTISPDDDLYGYDEFYFNIYKSNNY
jgi:hypothetical protein